MDSSSAPATPPQHLRHRPSPLLGGLGLSRRARLYRLATEPILPRERALADATVMADWLTAEQRTHYAPRLRAGDDLGTFVEHLADERRVVLEEGADPVADEVDSAREAEQAARQWPLRSVEAGLLVIMVACMIIAADRLAHSGGRDSDSDGYGKLRPRCRGLTHRAGMEPSVHATTGAEGSTTSRRRMVGPSFRGVAGPRGQPC